MVRNLASAAAVSAVLSASLAFADGPSAFRLEAKQKQALLEWHSESTFRFCLSSTASGCVARRTGEPVEAARSESESNYRFRTKFLDVVVAKDSLRLRVLDTAGNLLMEDLREVVPLSGGLVVERSATADERFFGFGMRGRTPVNARGLRIEALVPFLLSSRGYGLHHVAPGKYTFDLAAERPDRYQVLARTTTVLDFYFYYGPRPKDILEAHSEITGSPEVPHAWQFGVIRRSQAPKGAIILPVGAKVSWASLGETVRAMVNGAMSATLIPAFDLTPYLSSSGPLFRAAALLGSVAPVTLLEEPAILLEPDKLEAFSAMAKLRKGLQSHFVAYAVEANTRGLPIIHPLALQFPGDVEAARTDDAFMLGDELLVAPFCTEASERRVYLPMGIWTDFRTNAIHRGRQAITVHPRDGEPPMFVRNGSILPLDPLKAGDPMLLHYVPKLAAEYFLYEPDLGEYSQLHAGPAGDAMRLEIESRKDRLYEWVVRHMPEAREALSGETRLRKVGSASELRPGSWCYEKHTGSTHVRVRARKNADSVVYLNY